MSTKGHTVQKPEAATVFKRMPLIKRSDYVPPATNPYRFRLEETTGWHRGKPAEASRGA